MDPLARPAVPAPTDSRRDARLRGVLAWSLLVDLCIVLVVAPFLPEPGSLDEFRVAAYATHAVFFGLVTAWVALVVRFLEPVRSRTVVVGMVVAAAASMLLNVLDVPVASDATKLVFGALAGFALSRMVERAWWLLPICVLVPLADAWSVFSERGVTHAIVERAREDPVWLDWPTIATPIAGLDYAEFGRIGIVDVLFVGVFLGVAARAALGLWRCAAALAVGFVGTSVLVFEDLADAVPALPLLCIAFVLAAAPGLWRDLRATPRLVP